MGWLFDLEIACRAALTSRRRRPPSAAGPTHLFLALVDHFEPHVGRAPDAVARRRLEAWLEAYPRVAGRHRDWDGRQPAHGFFYPWDECDAWELERLADLCAAGWGELEVHLHHRDDTEETLRRKLRDALSAYRDAGALSRWPDGRPAWAFVHGNWALDNSRLEGGANFCGVNSEISVLRQEGCCADFTFPAWRHTAQPRETNNVYYATDDPALPKSHDRGTVAAVGRKPPEEGLLLVQGPLVPYVKRPGGVPRPAVDDGDLSASPARRYSPERLDRWVRAGVQVRGRPDWVFVKLYCHGAADGSREALLERDLEALFSDAEGRYNDGERYRLHYVTAREMFNLVRAAEAGTPIEPEAARDLVLARPGRG